MPSHMSKIAIIGAGPAGVHMAALLNQAGYSHVTLFEQSNRIGGKVYSIKENDVMHEMGGCYVSVDYKQVLQLIKELNIQNLVPIGARERKVVLDSRGEQDIPYPDWIKENLVSIAQPAWCQRLPYRLHSIKLLIATAKYIRLHRKIFKKPITYLPPRPSSEQLTLIDMSLAQFLRQNQIEALLPLMRLMYTAQGYGFPEEVSALYALWWVTPKLLWSCVKNLLNKSCPVAFMLPQGIQFIWERLAKKNNLNILFNATVQSIQRNDQKENSVAIECLLANQEKKIFYFDEVILAIHMKKALALLKPPYDYELEAFNQLRTKKFISVLFACDVREKLNEKVIMWINRIDPSQPGLGVFRNSAAYLQENYSLEKSNKQMYVCYQYFSGFSDENFDMVEAKNKILIELEQSGFKNVEIKEMCEWNYFPHFSVEKIAEGYPWKVLDFQGKHHTWYIGSSVCFESMEAVVNYNLNLIKKIVPFV